MRAGKLLIIAANRSLMTVKRDGQGKLIYSPSSGGLASAISAVEEHNIVNIGWPGLTVDTDEQQEVAETFRDNNMLPVFLSDDEITQYYDGCNKILWPLFHEWPEGGIAPIEFDDTFWPSYTSINQRFADVVYNRAREEKADAPLVWIHDYHLMLAPQMITTLLPNTKIGFFLHIPFPPYATFTKYPEAKKMLGFILEGLRAVDHIAFHTEEYRQNFMNCMRSHYKKVDISTDGKHMIVNDRVIKVCVKPIGIDYKRYATDYSPIKELQKFFDDSIEELNFPQLQNDIDAINNYKKIQGHDKTILSIQRLDPSKGILQQLSAFNLYLEKHPELIGTIRFKMIVVPSRTSVAAYKKLKENVENFVTKINQKYKLSHKTQPIDYDYASFPLPVIQAMYRVADVMMVTPKRDGMNLVCQEYIAAHQDHLGVLILGKGAGAADSLCSGTNGALSVDPLDQTSMYTALSTALSMSTREQAQRMDFMHDCIVRNNVHYWAKENIEPLTQTRKNLPASPIQSPVRDIEPEMITGRRRSNSHPFNSFVRCLFSTVSASSPPLSPPGRPLIMQSDSDEDLLQPTQDSDIASASTSPEQSFLLRRGGRSRSPTGSSEEDCLLNRDTVSDPPHSGGISRRSNESMNSGGELGNSGKQKRWSIGSMSDFLHFTPASGEVAAIESTAQRRDKGLPSLKIIKAK